MRLSKRTEYGIMATARLADRARSGPGYLQSREIAENEQLPGKFLESILLALKSAGILESKVGAGGGYRLVRSPEELTLAEIVTVLETSSAKADDSEQAPTDTVGRQTLNLVNDRIDEAFQSKIGSLTVSDILDRLSSASPASNSKPERATAQPMKAAPAAAQPRPMPSFTGNSSR
jgi:Rrf2 family protein